MIALASTFLGIATGPAEADIEYRVVILEPEFVTGPYYRTIVPLPLSVEDQDNLGHFWNIESSIATAVNDHGVVVGAAYLAEDFPASGSESLLVGMRAFVWQGSPVHASLGVNTLNHVPHWNTGPNAFEDWSYATDLNVDGDVVGVAEAKEPNLRLGSEPRNGFVTPVESGLPHPTWTMTELLDMFGDDTTTWAISRRDPIDGQLIAVGVGSDLDLGCDQVALSDATSWGLYGGNLGTNLTPLGVSPPALPLDRAWARAISPDFVFQPEDPDVVGIIGGLQLSCFTGWSTCVDVEDEQRTAGWRSIADPRPVDDTADGFDWPSDQMRGANDFGVGVGSVSRDFNEGGPMGADCGERAARFTYMQSTGSFDLSLLPVRAEVPDNFTDANAINNLGVAVGQDATAGLALRWKDGVAELLDDLVGGCGIDNVINALDVNNHGWITGIGSRTYPRPDGTSVETWVGVLLIPIGDCPEDVDRDGDVDADDLRAVQNVILTGTTSCSNIRQVCWEDVNGDCVVDDSDVKLVLRAMTQASCGQQTLSAPLVELWAGAGGMDLVETDDETLADSIETSYVDGSELETFVNLMTLIGGAS